MATEVHDLILSRRSIRRYTEEDVSPEQVQSMLEAAMAAPSASNRRPWRFVVVRDPELRQLLAQTHQYSAMAAHAPVVFVVCGDEQSSAYWVEDASAATQNLLLQANALGLGGVWVAIYRHETREAHVRQALGIPSAVRILCLLPIGHPAEEKPPRTQFDAACVHQDRW